MNTENPELLNLFPSRVIAPTGEEWGDQQNKTRSFLYRRPDGTTRFVVLDIQGVIIAKTAVDSYQLNGQGCDVVDTNGDTWYVSVIAGCSTCGGGTSAGRVFEMLRGQGEEL